MGQNLNSLEKYQIDPEFIRIHVFCVKNDEKIQNWNKKMYNVLFLLMPKLIEKCIFCSTIRIVELEAN